jgi:hypothetical protein
MPFLCSSNGLFRRASFKRPNSACDAQKAQSSGKRHDPEARDAVKGGNTGARVIGPKAAIALEEASEISVPAGLFKQ